MNRSSTKVDVVEDIEHGDPEPQDQRYIAVLPLFQNITVDEVEKKYQTHWQQSANDAPKKHHPSCDARFDHLQFALSYQLMIRLCWRQTHGGKLGSGGPLIPLLLELHHRQGKHMAPGMSSRMVTERRNMKSSFYVENFPPEYQH